MLDLIPSLPSWVQAHAGQKYAVATIIAASGSVPLPVGTSMIVADSGAVLGSLSGGCVEGAVVALAMDAMDDGGTRRESFGFSAADAFAAGLTCGGELDIHVQPVPAGSTETGCGAGPEAGPGAALRDALHRLSTIGSNQPAALVRRLDGRGSGAAAVFDPAGMRAAESPAVAALLPSALNALEQLEILLQVEAIVRAGGTGVVHLAGAGTCHPLLSQGRRLEADEPVLLVQSRLAPPRMLVFGANDFGAALVPAAKLLGYHVTLVDARPAFTSQPRFSAADAVVAEWPHRYVAAEAAAGRLDARTAVAVLTHDPKFDIPLLETVLALDLSYVGAMGSRRSHLQRVDDLLNAGVLPGRIARLHSPIGLDLGAVTPAEVAVSITAELVVCRNPAATCAPLRDRSGPIHQLSPVQPSAPAAPASATHQESAWI